MEGDINRNESPQVYKTFDDGYIVRAMTHQDAKIVQGWYLTMGIISKYDLDVALESYPPGSQGFYIGEFNGEVVASAIRIPWGDNVFYGSYYYVAEAHRRAGFGTRLRDQVARAYVGDSILCVDAVHGSVAENNQKKFGYVEAFKTGRFQGVAKDSVGVTYEGKIVKAQDVPFEKVHAYDNKCFVSQNFGPRKTFLQKWLAIPDGQTYVALDEADDVIGFGCRRPCIQEGHHHVGPLYAETPEIAEALLQKLSQEVSGENVTLNIWYPNEGAVAMVKKFGMENVFDVHRQHVNGDAKEFKDTTFCLTSIDICGF